MRTLGLSSSVQLAGFVLLAVQTTVGIIMFAHGLQKLQGGRKVRPDSYGDGCTRAGTNGVVATFVELVGGALLIVWLLS